MDGWRFTFQAPLEPLELRAGGYVELETPGDRRLGQLLSLDIARIDAGEVGWTGATTLSSHVTSRLATGEGAPSCQARRCRSTTPRSAPPRPPPSRPGRTRRRRRGRSCQPASCASRPPSRSGWTPAASTSTPSCAGNPAPARRTRSASWSSGSCSRPDCEWSSSIPTPISYASATSATTWTRHSKGATGRRPPAWSCTAAALRLDPIADREEYAELVALLDGDAAPTRLEDLDATGRPGAETLARRARNLGADRWGIWARQDAGSTLETLGDPAVRCLVVDLGSLATPQEQALVAEAILERLWRRRSRREPMLIVIDEAHNVCAAQLADGLTALATEHAVRIAAEGRKFGLYLLASTQRPQKVHENGVSQCDNLVLMRMNSAADLGYASDVFSFVHPGLLAQAGAFGLGEALIAGRLSSHRALVRMGLRIAEEGGADVPTTWAQPAKFTRNG